MANKQTLPILPLEENIILPHGNLVIPMGTDTLKVVLRAIQQSGGKALLVPHLGGKFATVGTIANLQETAPFPNGVTLAAFEGLSRAELGQGSTGLGGALWVEATELIELDPPSQQALDLAREYLAILENLLEKRRALDLLAFIRSPRSPAELADLSGYSPDLSLEQKLEILESKTVEERLGKLVTWTQEILKKAVIHEEVRAGVEENMQKTQRDWILRQELEDIKKKLGEGKTDLATEYRTKLTEAILPKVIREELGNEIDRLENASEQSPEYGWIRTYLDWMFSMPWSKRSEDNLDLVNARTVLDEDHNGLEKVKDRIIEFLAVRKLRAERHLTESSERSMGAIITLIGPPGTGKTSLGESIARALGRKFVRISLGGIHEEAEIRGFRRTYVGSQPGRIVRALRDAGTKNPVIMLDEIDKVGADWRGDPSSALLEVLDPAQNHTFRDHYLDVDLDLSEVLFIPTGNVSDTIPGPLLDRMEVIQLDGYTEQEKVAIAKDHLLPRQLTLNGLQKEELLLPESTVLKIITDHTREVGVRQLERELGQISRKVVTQITTAAVTPPVTITPENLKDYLGKPRFREELQHRTSVPGVATGLAVTQLGGDILFIEVTKVAPASEAHPIGELRLTGQLGDVMKESAEIALSYIRSHAKELDIKEADTEATFHLHVPQGAVPKDGPSAGVAITTALISLLLGKPTKDTVGMTGEVTLQGLILPIGGIKQKLLAAERRGLTEVIIPRANEVDLDDLPASVRKSLKIHLVSEISELIPLAFSN